jgi:ribose 5-phosphate isomerase B
MIYVAGDHYAVELVSRIKDYLETHSVEFEDLGTQDKNQKISLQEIIPAVTNKVLQDKDSSGILVCGTGVGVEVGANKFKGIRASLCRDAKQAEYARVYDNANVLCLASWLTDNPDETLESWLKFKFDGDEKRTQMLKDFEEWR